MSNSAKAKQKPAALSLAAGVIAGGVEGFITFPTEYIKTRLQIPGNTFKGPIDALFKTVRERGFFGLYKGLTPLVVGNASKAGVRFLFFDQFKAFFLSAGISLPNSLVLAGLGAGITEAILVVTPSETIKTKLIHDQNIASPRYKGLAHGIKLILREEGVRGVYRGLSAVVARQGANSAVPLFL